jgi:cytokinin dehydrogenase
MRARLGLVEAPTFVVLRTMTYDTLDTFLSDQARLTEAPALGPLNGRLTRDPQGSWQFSLIAGDFAAAADGASSPPEWAQGLRNSHDARPAILTFLEYLDRRTKSITAGRARKTPNPALVISMPASSTKAFVKEILASPQLSAGIWFFEVSPKVPARHGRPLQKMPTGDLAYELRMQRRASAVDAPDHKAMLATNEQLIAKALARGGKVYPPFAPILTRAQWREHYGPEIWARFASAQKRLDPNNVLTPGAGIF